MPKHKKLDIPGIIKLIKAGEPAFITEAKKKQVTLNVHVNGRGVAEHLAKIEGFENKEQFLLRKKFALSNKSIMANLLRPVDKVFSAKGGSRIFNTKGKSENAKKELATRLRDVRHGFSIKKWIQEIQSNKYYSDPAGLVFFEWTSDETWPSIKSIQQIRNYKTDGRSLEWVLFEPFRTVDEKGKKSDSLFFRFVDSEFDYLFIKKGDVITHDKKETFANPWKRGPAIVNSEIINDRLKYSDSPVDVVVDIADKYLRDNSVKSIYQFLHGYPLFWMYARQCSSCKGTGEGNDGKCTSCNGSGTGIKRDVSNVLTLKPPKTKKAPVIAPDVAGYVQPDLETWQEQRTELDWMWQLMHFTVWGTSYSPGENATATARFLDVQPVNDRLGLFSDSFEDMEQKMTDFIGEFYLSESYEGSSISYGRRYMMETADKVWEKYLTSKDKKAPKSSLDHLLNQYYQSEFMNDIQMLAIMVKGMKVEPFVHDTNADIKADIDNKAYTRKIYFGEWWKTLQEEFIITSNLEALNKSLDDYISKNVITKTTEE